MGTRDANHNPITGNVSLRMMYWMFQYKITLLRNVVQDANREDSGVIPTLYTVDPGYVDVDAIGTGGGIQAALKNERYEQDQIATFYVDQDPAVRPKDALLFASSVFVIEAATPVGVIPIAWEIHATRVLHPDEGIRNLQVDVLSLKNNTVPGETYNAQGN